MDIVFSAYGSIEVIIGFKKDIFIIFCNSCLNRLTTLYSVHRDGKKVQSLIAKIPCKAKVKRLAITCWFVSIIEVASMGYGSCNVDDYETRLDIYHPPSKGRG